jgi:hypothetical protein
LDFVIRVGSFNFFIDKISKFHGCRQQHPDRFNRSGRDLLSSSSARSSSTNSTAGTAKFVMALREWAESFVAFGRYQIAYGW